MPRLPMATLACLTVALVGAATPLGAQDVIAGPGAKVRILTPDARVVGRLALLLSSADSSVVFCSPAGPPCPGQERTILRRHITAMDLAHGTHWRRGAIAGGAIGALVGGAAGLIVAAVCDAVTCSGTGGKVLIGAAAGAASVGAVGALLGSLFTRWEPAGEAPTGRRLPSSSGPTPPPDGGSPPLPLDLAPTE